MGFDVTTYQSSVTSGIHGELALDDVIELLKELDIRVQEAISNSTIAIKSRKVSHEPNGSNDMPPWLMSPVALHDNLNRWIQGQKLMSPNVRCLLAAEEQLICLGHSLGECAQQYITVSRTINGSKSLTTPRQSTLRARNPSQSALEASKRIHSDNKNVRSSDIKRWDNEELVNAQCEALANSLMHLKSELLVMQDVTRSLHEEALEQQGGLNEMETNVQNTLVSTVRARKILHGLHEAKASWIPLGFTLSGVGVGALCGLAGGPLGTALGSVIGGALMGGAVTIVKSNVDYTANYANMQ